MATEEQLVNNFDGNMYGPAQNIKVGQKLDILARTVSKLSFLLRKSGAPTGDVTFTIRKWSDKSLIASKLWGDASALTLVATWYEVTLDTPVAVNETAIIMVEFSGGTSTNYVRIREQSSDVKAGENDSRYSGGAWENNTGTDCAYIYTYELTQTPPTVTIQAMTTMARNTAKAHGNVTALGVPNPTAHGHCWNTTGTPTTADSKTDLGAKSATGAYESDLTNLSPGITYYVRAYATNDAGTSYSSEINFTTRTGQARLYESLTTPTNDVGSVYGAAWGAQLFTPSVAHPIIKVRLKLYRTGSPGDLTVSIRAVSGGEPSGGDLCYGTINGNALTTDTDGEWVEIEFDLGTIQDLLAASTQYAIVLRAPSGDASNSVVFRGENSGVYYTGGYRCTSSDSGSSWTQYGSLDILFEEWGTIIGAGGFNSALLEML